MNDAIFNAEVAGDGVVIYVVSERFGYLAIKPFFDKLRGQVGKAVGLIKVNLELIRHVVAE